MHINTIDRLLHDEGSNYIFPFLWMHGESEETLRKYVQVIYDCNVRALCVESRPHPDFAGPGWWHDMDIILEEAKKRDMKVWILDDSHFPTGHANGVLKDAPEELCRQFLTYQIIDMKKSGEAIHIDLADYAKAPACRVNDAEKDIVKIRTFDDDKILGVLAVKAGGQSMDDIISLTDLAADGKIDFYAPEGIWKIYICHLTRNRGPHRIYMNMLSKRSCHKLIEAVYEPHFEHYAEEFGKTIMGFFSDEPELGNDHLYEYQKRIFEIDDQPWSQEIQEELEQKWGNEFLKTLPLLWEQDFADHVKAKVRFLYMDTISRAVEKCFSCQLGDWCRDHGVKYIGHLIEDNNQHSRTGSSLGHFFRAMIGQDMAGIDNVGGQVLYQGEWNNAVRNGEFYHFVLGKLGTSMAAIEPRKKGRTMCEIFGAYGWEEGVHSEKYQADHFLVRGVNHFVPHGFSPAPFPDEDCPPHFYAHGHNPLYRHFGALMKYMNRICEIMSDGHQDAPAAILYNAEADWSGECMMLEKPARVLAENQIEYLFLPSDIFEKTEYYRTKAEKKLTVKDHTYEILIIPYMQFIPEITVKNIEKLRKAGFPVVFIEGYPKGTCEGEIISEKYWQMYELISLENLADYLEQHIEQTIHLEPADCFIRYRHYIKDTDYYMFVNEGTETYCGTIHVSTQGNCYIYNAWDNRREKIHFELNEHGTLLHVKIEPRHSLIVVFEEGIDGSTLPLPIDSLELESSQNWNMGWSRSICKSIDYPNFGISTPVKIPDSLAEEEPEFSGFARYENTYIYENTLDPIILEITDAYEGVELFVNEQSLGIQVVPPYRYNLSSFLKEGENQICIEVATTLERETAKNPGIYLKAEEKTTLSPTGITGEIFLLK